MEIVHASFRITSPPPKRPMDNSTLGEITPEQVDLNKTTINPDVSFLTDSVRGLDNLLDNLPPGITDVVDELKGDDCEGDWSILQQQLDNISDPLHVQNK